MPDHTALPPGPASLVLHAGQSPSARHAAASTASRPNVGDDGRRPSSDRDGGSASADLPDDESGIFLQTGLDAFYRFARRVNLSHLADENCHCGKRNTNASTY